MPALFGKEDRAWHPRPQGVNPECFLELSVMKAWVLAKLDIQSERGANLVEYVFLLVFIALVVVIAVTALGKKVSTKFDEANNNLG